MEVEILRHYLNLSNCLWPGRQCPNLKAQFSRKKSKTLVFNDWKWAVWAWFRENWTYNSAMVSNRLFSFLVAKNITKLLNEGVSNEIKRD